MNKSNKNATNMLLRKNNSARKPAARQNSGRNPPNTGRTAVAAAYSTAQRSVPARIQSSKNSVRIKHKELVANISGSVDFTVALSMALNPGLSTSFPWLASQAAAWETYHFHSLRYCYHTRTGTGVPGSVILAPDYDASDAAPSSELAVSNYEDMREDAPWKDVCSILNESAMYPLGPRKYIRNGALSSNVDVKTYDVGTMHICTIDGTAVPWGKLWVEYDVTLETPAFPAGGFIQTAALIINGVTPTSASLLGTQTVLAGSTEFATVSGEIITFNTAGDYQVSIYSASATTSFNSSTLSAGSSFLSGPISGGSGSTIFVYIANIRMVVSGTLTVDLSVNVGTTAGLRISRLPAIY
jgi:hypothetical protein